MQRVEIAAREDRVEAAHPVTVVEHPGVDGVTHPERHLPVERREVAQPAAPLPGVRDDGGEFLENIVDVMRGHAFSQVTGPQPVATSRGSLRRS